MMNDGRCEWGENERGCFFVSGLQRQREREGKLADEDGMDRGGKVNSWSSQHLRVFGFFPSFHT